MLDLVRNIMSRDFAGIENSRLYETALTGTKELISQFQATVTDCLHFIQNHPTFEDKLVSPFKSGD